MKVRPRSTSAMLKHQEEPWVTLMTCRGYDASTDIYDYRVLVRAVLIELK
jgi:sortase (surface protein transpeptidase)